MTRKVSWLSMGIPSTIATLIALEKYEMELIYCNSLAEEHSDNLRFLNDLEKLFNQKIIILSNKTFTSPTEIFIKRKYMSGIHGAPCTVELKKRQRFDYQLPDDINIWGYYVGEEKRIKRFQENNPELNNVYPLIENNINKTKCHELFQKTGIQVPKMYQLGFDNNNCIGCVKATSPSYWNNIRKHFPEQFNERAKLSRELNCRLVTTNNKRIFLDELHPHNQQTIFEQIDCGVHCGHGI